MLIRNSLAIIESASLKKVFSTEKASTLAQKRLAQKSFTPHPRLQ